MSGDYRIVPMANQIAAFFAAYPHDQAVAAVSDHLDKFWDPRMKRKLVEHVAAGAEGLEPLAREAAVQLGTELARRGVIAVP